MYDSMANFYGGYERAGLIRPVHVPWIALTIGISGLVLLGFVAADVAAVQNRPVSIEITAVDWDAYGGLLATTTGFSMHASQITTLTLLCSTVCLRFNGATVSSPFVLVTFALSYSPDQYTNVTVQAPVTGFTGPLTISLSVA